MIDSLITNEIFGEKNTVGIILFLHLFGPKSRSEIYKAISTNPRMPLKLDMLEGRGIIETLEKAQTNHRLIALTPLGKKYAHALCALEKCTGGDIDKFKGKMLKQMISDHGKIKL